MRREITFRRRHPASYPGRVRSCSGWHAPGWPIVRPQGSWLPSTVCGHLSRSSHPPSAFSALRNASTGLLTSEPDGVPDMARRKGW